MNSGLKNYIVFPLVGSLFIEPTIMGITEAEWSRAIAQSNFCPDPGPIPAVADTRQLPLPQLGLN